MFSWGESGRRLSGGEKMKPMEALLHAFEDKMKMVHRLIDEYDETMDFASHCSLQGFAEGLGFAIEETRERIEREKDTTS
jgi:hypothetical protein